MLIRFENKIEDMVAFQKFHYAYSPFLKRFMAGLWWGGALLIFGIHIAFLLMLGVHLSPVNVILGLLPVAFYAVILPPIIQSTLKYQVQRMYSEGRNKGFLCEHELEITSDGIIERTEYNETKTAWGAVERIESTPEYTFIYIGSHMAHVIPHDKIVEGDYRAFLTSLGQQFQPDQKLVRVGRQ